MSFALLNYILFFYATTHTSLPVIPHLSILSSSPLLLVIELKLSLCTLCSAGQSLGEGPVARDNTPLLS